MSGYKRPVGVRRQGKASDLICQVHWLKFIPKLSTFKSWPEVRPMKRTATGNFSTDDTRPLDTEMANKPTQDRQALAFSEPHLMEPESVILARVYEFILSWPDQDGEQEISADTKSS